MTAELRKDICAMSVIGSMDLDRFFEGLCHIQAGEVEHECELCHVTFYTRYSQHEAPLCPDCEEAAQRAAEE